MTRHTPGPWEAITEWADGAEVVDSRGYEVASLNTGGVAINRDWLDNHPDEHWAHGGDASHIERPGVEIEANARLIAAAPAMLAMLLDLEWSGTDRYDGSYYDCCPVCEGGRPDDRCTPSMYAGHADDCHLDALIATAGGRSS